MSIRVAINGFGRIGRNVLRALYESSKNYDIKIVAINDLGDAAINAHLLKYDTAHGIFAATVSHDEQAIYVNDDQIKTLSIRNPAELPWSDLKIDVVLECTGLFTDRKTAGAHLTPGKDVDATVVYGVNHQVITPQMTIISNASCTTNCLAPIAKPLSDALGIESGLMTTIHAYTNDQRLSDVYHTDVRRARAAAMSMIPTKTGAAAQSPMNQVLAVNDLPLVSVDFNHNPMSSIFDATETRVNGRLVKVMSWYDNEWGFSNRMLDNVVELMK